MKLIAIIQISFLILFFNLQIEAAQPHSSKKNSEHLSESKIRTRLDEMGKMGITDAKALQQELDLFSRYASSNKLLGLETLIASEQASIFYSLGNLEKAEQIIQSSIDNARKYNEINALFAFYYLRSKIANKKSEHEISIQLGEQMLDLALATKDKSKIADAYTLLGQVYTSINDLKRALGYVRQALALFEETNDNLGVSIANSSIASIYGSLNEQKQAIAYYKKALPYLIESNERFNQSIVLFNIGLAYFILEEYKNARSYFEQALHISIELGDDLGIAYAQMRIARIESLSKNYESAINLLEKSLPIFEASNDLRMSYVTSIALASNTSLLGQHQKAIDIIRPLEETSKSLKNIDYELTYYSTLTEVLENAGNFQLALDAHKQYLKRLSIQHQTEKEKTLAEERVKFDTEQKEKTNQLLLQENEIKQMRIVEGQKKNLINKLIISLIATVSIVISYLLFKQVQLRKMYRNMALRDDLTGAYNRRAIMAFGQSRLQEAKSMNSTFTIALMDLDHFKKFNDSYGHEIGDEVLKVFAQAANSAIRSNDRLGRFGGEEWLYILPDTNPHIIDTIFERVQNQLAKVHIIGLPKNHKITFSMGVATTRNGETKLEELIKIADKKLYQAKSEGRNRFIA